MALQSINQSIKLLRTCKQRTCGLHKTFLLFLFWQSPVHLRQPYSSNKVTEKKKFIVRVINKNIAYIKELNSHLLGILVTKFGFQVLKHLKLRDLQLRNRKYKVCIKYCVNRKNRMVSVRRMYIINFTFQYRLNTPFQ